MSEVAGGTTVPMNREQMVAWLILEGYTPINDPWDRTEKTHAFHNAMKVGGVNISAVISDEMLKFNAERVRVSYAHSWDESQAGSWDIIPDLALRDIYEKAVTL